MSMRRRVFSGYSGANMKKPEGIALSGFFYIYVRDYRVV